ncbi:MAG: hypothetical protein ACE5FA_00255 [Dehalococcoidia bacterium]
MIEAARTAELLKSQPLANVGETPLLLDEHGLDIDEQTVLEFFSLKGLGRAFTANEWSAEEEVRILRSIAQDEGEEAPVRMKAAAEIRKIAMQVVTLRGLVRKIDATTERDGQRMQVSGAVLSDGALATEKLLERASVTSNVLNALPSTTENEQDGNQIEDHEEITGGFTRKISEDPEGGAGFDEDATPEGDDDENGDALKDILEELDPERDDS